MDFGLVDRGDPEADEWMHWVCWIGGRDFGEEEDEPDIVSQSQYIARLTWNPSAYGYVCASIDL